MKNLIRWLCAATMARALALRSRPYGFPSGPALIIAPHADDETLGCGGLIAAKRLRGQTVHVVFITDSAGSHEGHPTLARPALAVRRHAEALAALQLLGVTESHVTFCDSPDGALNRLTDSDRQALTDRLTVLLREVQAVEVFAPCREDGSSEHSVVQQIALIACRRCGHGTLMEYPVWAWWNPFRLRHRLGHANQNYRLELGSLRELKQRALACHQSQLSPAPPWTEPALPPILAQLCGGPTEFFFRRSTT